MKNVSIFYQVVVRHASRLTVFDSGLQPAHSFTIGFSKILFNVGLWIGAESPVAVTSTSGVSVTNTFNSSATQQQSLRTDAGTTTSTYGIQVGTGTAAESINDTSLQTQISHGTSVGNLQYGAMTYGAPSTTATTTTFRCTRVFTNGSGGTVTVQEIGLVSRTTNSILMIRDLTGAVAVTNGQQLTVNYDFTTTI